MLPLEVTVNKSDAKAWIVMKTRNEVLDYNRCEDSLPCSGDAWTEQRLFDGLESFLELRRV